MILLCSRRKRAPSIAGSNTRRTGYNGRSGGVGRMRNSSLKFLILLASFGASGDPFERVQHHVKRAAEYVEARNYALARSYLEPVLISPWITGAQRARAYVTQAFTYSAEGMYVSAAQDYVRALEFDPDQTTAFASLSYLYAHGLGVAQDEDEALRLALEAAQRGDGYSRVYVGMAFMDEDIDEARSWLLQAAEDGYAPAYVHLAHSFRGAVVDEPDPEQAKRWYEAAAEEGSVAASLAIAYMYRDGELGEPGRRGGRAPLRDPGRQRFRPCKGSAGAPVSFCRRRAIETSPARSRCIRKRRKQGVTDAYTGLGYLYETGTGTGADLATAESWYRRGAEQDDPVAQYQLGSLILQPAQQDKTATALYWFERAASTGHLGGENNAAWILATSRHNRIRNGALALHLAQRAVDQAENPGTLDTLAAAHAENGDFARAIATQRSAIAAISSDTEYLRAELAGRLAIYEAREPWRE